MSSNNNNNTGFLLSASEKRYILDGCNDNCRTDGRQCHEFRYYTVVAAAGGGDENSENDNMSAPPPIIQSNGSSRLFLHDGGVHLMCSVKAELVHPSMDCPNEGCIEIKVDDYNSATKRSATDHLESLLSRLLLTSSSSSGNSSNTTLLKSLCIVPNHYVWKLQVDIFLLSGSSSSSVTGTFGSHNNTHLLDCCSYAIKSALQSTILPNVITTKDATTAAESNDESTVGMAAPSVTMGASANVDLTVDSDMYKAKRLLPATTARIPTILTITILKDRSSDNNDDNDDDAMIEEFSKWHLVLDATIEEQLCSHCQVHIAIQPGAVEETATIYAMTKSGNGAIPVNLLPEITSLALGSYHDQQRHYVTASSSSSTMKGSNDDEDLMMFDNTGAASTSGISAANYGWLQQQFLIQ